MCPSIPPSKWYADQPWAIFDQECVYGITQADDRIVNILLWIWKGEPGTPILRPPSAGYVHHELRGNLRNCSNFTFTAATRFANADEHLSRTLNTLQELLEVEILRATFWLVEPGRGSLELARSWMIRNLSFNAPILRVCDYLGMSPNTLHSFFVHSAGRRPEPNFRRPTFKLSKRLIDQERWQVKAAAFKLRYKHLNDLSHRLTRGQAQLHKISWIRKVIWLSCFSENDLSFPLIPDIDWSIFYGNNFRGGKSSVLPGDGDGAAVL